MVGSGTLKSKTNKIEHFIPHNHSVCLSESLYAVLLDFNVFFVLRDVCVSVCVCVCVCMCVCVCVCVHFLMYDSLVSVVSY